MRLIVLAVAERPPAWLGQGIAEYAKRLPKPYTPDLVDLAPAPRGKHPDLARAVRDEGQRVLAALPRNALLVALDERGTEWTSPELARRLNDWSQLGRDLVFAIGGADGHAPDVVQRADQRWSLGRLTLPHHLARLIVVEQLYRAWSLVNNHPYHRA